MVDILVLLLLGTVAGFTIFLGLPVALIGIGVKVRGFLNAFAIGILLFLIVDVFSHAWNQTTASAHTAFVGHGSVGVAAADLALMFGGITLGLLGLVAYERTYMRKSPDGLDRSKLSTMTALGIGAHNLSEGLAIGQAYLAGLVGLGSGGL